MWVSARARPPHFQQGACYSSGGLPKLVAWHPVGWRRPCLPGEAELKWSCSAHWPRPRSQLEVCTEEQQGPRKRLLWLPLPYDGLTSLPRALDGGFLHLQLLDRRGRQ